MIFQSVSFYIKLFLFYIETIILNQIINFDEVIIGHRQLITSGLKECVRGDTGTGHDAAIHRAPIQSTVHYLMTVIIHRNVKLEYE